MNPRQTRDPELATDQMTPVVPLPLRPNDICRRCGALRGWHGHTPDYCELHVLAQAEHGAA